ncbi:MAG: phosphoribosylamine--glycine ligase [Cohaesibacteraceae bacterium]|nr:phosphoribosylamine--glycine ligase [Cohaesibacteraceae bacterium]MBL4874887.1 phosphoribosylamine--glycine ligase [Cohaesibacteraceae bacterium]
MNVLLIGSGGREHALAYAISASPRLTKLFASPGNPGIAQFADCVSVDVLNHDAVIVFCKLQNITFVVVGPEAPLVDGLIDSLNKAGIACFGPSKAAARLEGSKNFTKTLCARNDIPTAAYGHFTNVQDALAYVDLKGAPLVIKADGLAAGKGVTIAMELATANAAVKDCFDGAFGDAGTEIIIEELLVGEEASFFVLADGISALPLTTAQDHKQVGEGDTGPNTGGMGAYSPAPVMTDELINTTMESIIYPTLKGMTALGAPFKGVLYAGLMLTKNGPQLIEYNVRFGDPECQVMMKRLKGDMLELMISCHKGDLETKSVNWSTDTAVSVVMAANGYPAKYNKGTVIRGVSAIDREADTCIFHAGTKMKNGQLQANGGRVLNVTALGETVTEAQKAAYALIETIDWPEGFYRKDIAWRAIERENR